MESSTILFLLSGAFFYIINMGICAIIHSERGTRGPEGFFDFIRLTFLPYVLYCLLFDKTKLD